MLKTRQEPTGNLKSNLGPDIFNRG